MSNFVDNYINDVQNVMGGNGTGGTKYIDGKSMNLNQALTYVNTARVNDPKKYQELIQIMRAAGYSIPGSENPETVVSRWDTFVRDLFASQDEDVFTYVSKRRAQDSDTGESIAEYPSLTDRAGADFELDTAFRDYLGVTTTKAERKAYYKALSQLEKSRPTRQVTRRVGNKTVQTTIGGVTEEEKEELRLQFVSNKAKALNLGDIGGTLSTNMKAIKRLVAMNGVVLGDNEVRKLAIDSATGTPFDTIQNKITNLAKARYTALTPYLDQGLSVNDIAQQYINEKADLLELNPNQISLRDNDITQALTGQNLESLYDFRKRMRTNPLFQYTERAREEASSYVNDILGKFGLV